MAPNSLGFIQYLSTLHSENGEIDPIVRGAILILLEQGESKAAVSRLLNVSRPAIYKTLERWKTHHTIESLPRSGRKKLTTPSNDQYIKIIARRNPRDSHKSIIYKTDARIGATILKRRLRTKGLFFRRAAKRIPLKTKDIQARRKFLRYWLPRLA